MNEIHLAARFAQGLLAVTIVSAIGLVVQLSLPQTMASRFA
jgi:hypothetical protein